MALPQTFLWLFQQFCEEDGTVYHVHLTDKKTEVWIRVMDCPACPRLRGVPGTSLLGDKFQNRLVTLVQVELCWFVIVAEGLVSFSIKLNNCTDYTHFPACL